MSTPELSIRSLFALILLLGSLNGCGPSPVEIRAVVVPAKGTLKYKGQPVAGAQLTFLNAEFEEPGLAQTDGNGKFRCMTNDSSEGIRPGEYVVVVTHPKGGVPAKYAKADTSPLSVTVAEDDANEFPLKLED